MVTVQIWLDYQPFTSLISLNYHSFIGHRWSISKIQLKYKGGADSLLHSMYTSIDLTYIYTCKHSYLIIFFPLLKWDVNNCATSFQRTCKDISGIKPLLTFLAWLKKLMLYMYIWLKHHYSANQINTSLSF